VAYAININSQRPNVLNLSIVNFNSYTNSHTSMVTSIDAVNNAIDPTPIGLLGFCKPMHNRAELQPGYLLMLREIGIKQEINIPAGLFSILRLSSV